MKHTWLEWAKRIQSIAQAGLAYSKDPFDIERFHELRTISAEIVEKHTDVPFEKIRDLFLNETGYQTPKIDIRAVVFQGNKLLLVQEKSDQKWTLPGGWAEPGYSLSENVVKEVKEESGYNVQATRVLAILDRDRHGHTPNPYSIYKIFVLCDFLGGAPQASIETSDVGFFDLESLPPLSVDRITEKQVRKLVKIAKDNIIWFD
ncbi:NUDIX hydrolase [Risungbinella massiliensis]|uniref:NUDIX hydrolase n=1 Tax=Risungbinella massiliensis TaxID=1329796 RepID=UPI0005CC8181|nr:NUDIX hydrolase [Risungbinella massiliensis]